MSARTARRPIGRRSGARGRAGTAPRADYHLHQEGDVRQTEDDQEVPVPSNGLNGWMTHQFSSRASCHPRAVVRVHVLVRDGLAKRKIIQLEGGEKFSRRSCVSGERSDASRRRASRSASKSSTSAPRLGAVRLTQERARGFQARARGPRVAGGTPQEGGSSAMGNARPARTDPASRSSTRAERRPRLGRRRPCRRARSRPRPRRRGGGTSPGESLPVGTSASAPRATAAGDPIAATSASDASTSQRPPSLDARAPSHHDASRRSPPRQPHVATTRAGGTRRTRASPEPGIATRCGRVCGTPRDGASARSTTSIGDTH